MAKKNSRDRRRQRREDAEGRAAAREARGIAGQLVRLAEAGHAHCREFKRLYPASVAGASVEDETEALPNLTVR